MSLTRHPLREPRGPAASVPIDLDLVLRLERSVMTLILRRAEIRLVLAERSPLQPPDDGGGGDGGEPLERILWPRLWMLVCSLRDPLRARAQAARLRDRLERAGIDRGLAGLLVEPALAALARASGDGWSDALAADWRETLRLTLTEG